MILFFEEVGTAPIRIDRALLYLERAGKLEGVQGSSSASSRAQATTIFCCALPRPAIRCQRE